MNRRKAMILAMKAAMMAEFIDGDVDEAIRYLSAVETLTQSNLERISTITGIPITRVKELHAADMLMNFC